MRQFKFRAWHKELKIISDFTLTDILASQLSGQYIIVAERALIFTLSECEIMQYLGEDCKDINGVELCEGDIVKISFGPGTLLKEPEIYICQIIYKEASFLLLCDNGEILELTDDGEMVGIFQFIDYCEIIGNIYQNPELLGEDK